MTRDLPPILEVPALDGVAAGAEVPVIKSLTALRREIADAWMKMQDGEVAQYYAGPVGQIHQMVCRSGLQQYPSSTEDVEFSRALRARLAENAKPGAGMLLAALLYLAPQEFPHIVEVPAVPAWFRASYIDLMLAAPALFQNAGEADAYRDFMARWVAHLREFVAAAPRGEDGSRLAQRFGESAQFHPVYFNSANVRDIFQARAQILEASLEAIHYELDWKIAPREPGGPIRLGILALNFSPHTETFATLPVFRHLDRSRFEVTLFALHHNGNRMEEFCASQANRYVCLPADLQAQVRTLREADLDLLFIGTNVTATGTDATALVLHRLARVQTAGICCCVTTGMRNVDCFLSGTLSEPADGQSHYTEKLYLMDGPAHCFDFGEKAPAEAAPTLRREDFGIPRDAIVFASGANFHKILPELEAVWLRILASVPDSRLLLYPFNPNWHGYPVAAFSARLAAGLRRHDIDPRRLLMLAPASNHNEILPRLGLADLYLDSFPFSGATSLLDPLLAGLPTVVLDGSSHRSMQAAGILRSLGLDELVAHDVDAYISCAIRLAANRSRRNALRARIRALMHDNPVIFDGRRYAAQVSRAFEQMWQDHGAGRLTEIKLDPTSADAR